MKRKLLVLVVACIIPLTSSAAYLGWSDWESKNESIVGSLLGSSDLSHLGIILIGIAGLTMARKQVDAK